MSLSIIGIILSAALLHAIWNSIVKAASDRTTTLGLIAFGHAIPGTVMVAVLPLPSAESFIYIILSTLLHFGYYFMLGRAYQYGDLSIVYPIARGIVPALVSLWAMLLLGEVLSGTVWLGIGLIVTGIALRNWKALRMGLGKAALGLALGTACAFLFIPEPMVLAFACRAIRLAIGLGVHFCICLSLGLLGGANVKHWQPCPSRIWLLGIAGGFVSMSAYGLVLYAKNFAPLGVVSALRETSVIFATLIGFLFLKEGNLKRRLGAAVLMVFSISLIASIA